MSSDNNMAYVHIRDPKGEMQSVKAFSLSELKDLVLNPTQHTLDITLEWQCTFMKDGEVNYFFVFCIRMRDQSSEIFGNYFIVTRKEEFMDRVFKGQSKIINFK